MLTRQLSITRMISKEETKANPDLELMRSKSQSLHDLKRKVTEDDNNPKPMADKIDDFLQTVNQQQEALNKLLEERRRHKGSQLRGTRRTSSLAQRLSTPTLQATLQTTNRKAKNNPDEKRKSVQSKKFQKPLANAIPVIDASRITSKLKTDRNYQPPRRQKASVGQRPHMAQRKSMEVQEDYGDDFEPDNDEDDDDDNDNEDEEEEDLNAVAKQKEAWLYDQAIRGRARQKAALLRKQFHHEKESSKDSAYGFSGGENSRLHTREPTPDANNHFQPRLIHSRLKGPRAPTSSAKKQLGSHSGSKNTAIRKSLEMNEYDSHKVDFLNQVTREILSRGLYTEKAILKAVEGQMDRETANLSLKQKSDMVQKLKLDLGLDQSRKKKQDYARTTSEESGISPPAPLSRSRPRKNPQAPIALQISSPEPDDSLKSLLKDESDEEIIEILKSTRQMAKHPSQPSKVRSPKHANGSSLTSACLNLTNLNVSFNSSNIQEAKRKLEESRTQASLVKSFAYDNKNETSEEAEEDQDSHSKSSMSNSSSSVKSLNEKYESDFVEEEIESGSASEIQDEDLP